MTCAYITFELSVGAGESITSLSSASRLSTYDESTTAPGSGFASFGFFDLGVSGRLRKADLRPPNQSWGWQP